MTRSRAHSHAHAHARTRALTVDRSNGDGLLVSVDDSNAVVVDYVVVGLTVVADGNCY